MMKKILVTIFLMFFIACLCGCQNPESVLYEDEYFVYRYHVYNYDKSIMDDCMHLEGLTEKGNEQEILIIPSQFNGKKVKLGTGYTSPAETHFKISNNNIKKIYVPEDVGDVYYISAPRKTKIFALSAHIDQPIQFTAGRLYITREAYERRPSSGSYPANVSYNWNYEEAPNSGYYWIDDYDNEIISYIPTDPTREGYIFDGWYKEPECINKWDFDNDIVLGTEWESIDEYPFRKIYQYQENILYAKWVEC